MDYTRTLNSGAGDTLELKVDGLEVEIETVFGHHGIEVELSTKAGQDSEAGRAIDRALLSEAGYKTTFTASGPYDGAGNIVVNSHGGITVTGSVSSSMSIIGNEVYINGRRVDTSASNSNGVKAKVRIPTGMNLELGHGSSSIRVSGDLSTLRGHLEAGQIKVEQAQEVDLTVASGSLNIGDIFYSARLTIDSGQAVIGRAGGSVDISVKSGRLTVDTIAGGGSIDLKSGMATISEFTGSRLRIRGKSGMLNHPKHPGIDAEMTTGMINGMPAMRGSW